VRSNLDRMGSRRTPPWPRGVSGNPRGRRLAPRAPRPDRATRLDPAAREAAVEAARVYAQATIERREARRWVRAATVATLGGI
jgi:hypothetical protein